MAERGNAGMRRFFTGVARNRYNKATSARGLDGEFLIGMLLALVAVVALWFTPFLFPFRIFTVSAHEASHALAVMLTGGSVNNIELYWNGGGLTTFIYRNGGANFFTNILVYSAGYLGSILFGGLLLLQAKRPDNRRRVLYIISAVLLVITAFFIRDITSFILIAIAVALAGGVAYKAPNIVVSFTVFVLALLSCFNSVSDLVGVLFSTTNPFHNGFNDAVGLQAATGIPALIWALVWALLGAFMMFMFVRRAIRKAPETTKGGFMSPAPSRNGASSESPFDRYDEYLSKK